LRLDPGAHSLVRRGTEAEAAAAVRPWQRQSGIPRCGNWVRPNALGSPEGSRTIATPRALNYAEAWRRWSRRGRPQRGDGALEVGAGQAARVAMPVARRPARHNRPAMWAIACAVSNDRESVAFDGACSADCAACNATCIACHATYFACSAACSALQCGLSADKCGLNADRCGMNTDRCGMNTDRCGMNTDRCGMNTDRCGINTDRCDIKDDRGRSNMGAMSSVRRSMPSEHAQHPNCFTTGSMCTSIDGMCSSCNRG
jgi:hypothetical protein